MRTLELFIDKVKSKLISIVKYLNSLTHIQNNDLFKCIISLVKQL